MRRPIFAAVAAALTLTQVLLARPAAVAAEPLPSTGATSAAAPRTVESFVTDLVIPHVDGFWRQAFRLSGRSYASPVIQILRQGDTTTCGGAPAVGHGYCFSNRTLALDVSTSTRLSFGTIWRQNEDYAVVTIVAHEFAHHVQNLLGINASNTESVAMELQADCMAGLYTRYAETQGILDPGDIEEGIAISRRSGDPTHGSGVQRAVAFQQGYQGWGGGTCGIR